MVRNAFRNPTEVYSYRYVDPIFPEEHPECRSWPEDSHMFFKRYQDQNDSEAISMMTSNFKIKIDQQKAKDARQNGGAANTTEMEQQLKMSTALAIILVMNKGWEGSYFTVPNWAVTSDGRPHPRRGQVAECNEAWIRRMDPVVLQDIEDKLSDLWEPRKKSDDEVFPGPSAGVDGPGRVGFGAGEERVGAGDFGLPAGENLRVDVLPD